MVYGIVRQTCKHLLTSLQLYFIVSQGRLSNWKQRPDSYGHQSVYIRPVSLAKAYLSSCCYIADCIIILGIQYRNANLHHFRYNDWQALCSLLSFVIACQVGGRFHFRLSRTSRIWIMTSVFVQMLLTIGAAVAACGSFFTLSRSVRGYLEHWANLDEP